MRSLMYLTMIFLLTNKEVKAQQQPRLIPHPELLAGRWETSNGHGGAVGMNVILETHIEGRPQRIEGKPQFEENLTVGLYERSGSEVEQLGFNFLSTSSGGPMAWDGHHLVIHLTPKAQLPAMNVDLIWHDELQTWTGSFERGAFHGRVTLKRPAFAGASSLFVGTWFDSRGLTNNCVHIARQEGGEYTAWSDDILFPAHMRFANGIQPPPYTLERYGTIAKAKLIAPGQITVELNAYTSMCCSQPFSAKVSADGTMLSGDWTSGMNRQARVADWKKMLGDSCISP
jgi:hypothetical protein